jgi:hypothetical protein
MPMTIRWVEISDLPQSQRFQALAQFLNENGFENEVSFLPATQLNFPEVVVNAEREFDQIRISGSLCQFVTEISDRLPSLLLSLKAGDALVQKAIKPELPDWWPRNFLVDGIARTLVTDKRNLDLSGAVFLLGAGCESRAAVAALVRLGFQRFSISCPDDVVGHALVEQLRTLYFQVQFQFIPRHLITQLPSIHSIAINTLVAGRDDEALSELFYFNFLKPGGIWLDLAFVGNQHLDNEARAVGAETAEGIRVAAWTDYEWAREVLFIKLDPDALTQRYREVFSRANGAPHTSA